MHVMMERARELSLYRVYSEGKRRSETTEIQGERRKGRRLRYIGEEGRKEEGEEEASYQVCVFVFDFLFSFCVFPEVRLLFALTVCF